MVTKDQVINAQTEWGNGVVKIGSLKENRTECENFTSDFLDKLYSFENGAVLFKPTKASEEQFRPNFQMALSYFLGGNNSFCSEDEGFAMKPWEDVKFENSGFIIENERAIAMGNYFFTESSGAVVKVEYTFGYKLRNGHLLIDLHHSSLPFSL